MSIPNEYCHYVPFREYDWEGLVVFTRHFNGTAKTDSNRQAVRCHGLAIPWKFAVICLFAAMDGVTVWICLDVMLQAVTTFKRWSTIYFWWVMVLPTALFAISGALADMIASGQVNHSYGLFSHYLYNHNSSHVL